jgi:hypothetical protein
LRRLDRSGHRAASPRYALRQAGKWLVAEPSLAKSLQPHITLCAHCDTQSAQCRRRHLYAAADLYWPTCAGGNRDTRLAMMTEGFRSRCPELGERVAASVPDHMWVRLEPKLSFRARLLDHRGAPPSAQYGLPGHVSLISSAARSRLSFSSSSPLNLALPMLEETLFQAFTQCP